MYEFFSKLVIGARNFIQSRTHPSAFCKKPNNSITVPLWVYLSGWMTRDDRNFIYRTITKVKVVRYTWGHSITILSPLRGPSSLLKQLFCLRAVIAQYDIQATANKPYLLPWISLSGSNKVQLCHKEKAVGNQVWWSIWQTEELCHQGHSPIALEWGGQRISGDSRQLRLDPYSRHLLALSSQELLAKTYSWMKADKLLDLSLGRQTWGGEERWAGFWPSVITVGFPSK